MSGKRFGFLKKIRPKTFYEELAELGCLQDFLKIFLMEKLRSDEKFRDEMFELLLKYSNSNIKEIESFYLESMIESLGFFLEFTKEWRTQEQ